MCFNSKMVDGKIWKMVNGKKTIPPFKLKRRAKQIK
jgi:hypothetical protein